MCMTMVHGSALRSEAMHDQVDEGKGRHLMPIDTDYAPITANRFKSLNYTPSPAPTKFQTLDPFASQQYSRLQTIQPFWSLHFISWQPKNQTIPPTGSYPSMVLWAMTTCSHLT